MDNLGNCIELISNSIAPFVPLIEIGCSIASWIIFLLLLLTYSQNNITGYEYYNNNVFVFQGSDPRERVSGPDCEYVASEDIGKQIISYLKYFSKTFLVVIGIIWLVLAGIIIIILSVYYLLKLKKVEINQRKRVYFDGIKLIFDFVIPLVMIPVSSVKVNDHCVTGYPYFYFLSDEPIKLFSYTVLLIIL